ncbi:hypothetical protein J5J83_15090 [Azoarcus sp. L1K30]|uniref:hypothetical protein n=1 Tax=Azoarcus sp. L1K30 TaxID=2820277 RepID=UPI001B82FE82|nr:hypothetical protein [Azoarcus sp. L1K30]MBR0567446.1 hypothetical protein [Azoarcus sp. L1K30]
MKNRIFVAALVLALPFSARADNVVADDSIIQGSQCVGMDCALGEVFSFETLRLKENNTRVRFVDTSSSGSFPSTDWELVANDSTNGGRNRFSVEDVTATREIFTLMGGAPSYSVFVSSTGDLGLGTNAPQKRVHVSGANAPAIRLEQNGSGGFTPAVWDIQANEAGLSVAFNGKLRMRLDTNGNLSLGGSVIASSIPANTVPDYVFASSYVLPPLTNVHDFIKTNGHLPGIPSAAEIERDGLNMTELQLKLLKKVEELTLYTVKQQEQIEALQARLQIRQQD